jgi:hypothetical protein
MIKTDETLRYQHRFWGQTPKIYWKNEYKIMNFNSFTKYIQ